MTDLSIASAVRFESAKETGDHSLKTIALFSCIGMMMSLCMMTLGVDFSAGLGLM